MASNPPPRDSQTARNNHAHFASELLSATSLGSMSLLPDGSPPIVHHAKTGDEQLVSWKNGLGSTAQIAIRPQERDPTKQSYIWRLALSRVKDSCTHPMIPGYDESFLLLPGVDTKLTDASSMHLYHNSQAESIKLYPLVPYTFSGNWTTTCKLESGEQRYLSLSVNRKLANASMTIENIYALKNENDAVSNGAEEHVDAVTEDATGAGDAKIKHAATNKFLMGRFTTVHVISGTIQLTVQGQDEAHVLQKGETLTCERERNASPTELAMTPLPSAQAGLGIQDPIMQEEGHSDSGAIVLVIQIQVFDNERSDNATSPFLGPPAAPQRPRLPSGQKSFIDDAAGIHDPNSKHWESAHIYRAPTFSARYRNESDVPPPVVRDRLVIEDFPMGAITTAWINMVKEGLAEWIRVPVIVARGVNPGPVVGITAVVHGNELNGVPCIHRVISDIDVKDLKGTLVAVPCVNVPGYLRFRREFSDGKDLNRYFPGSTTGTASQVYNHNFFEKIVSTFDFLIDLHTASFGRVNSYYVRADMNDPVSAVMAKLQQPQIILHNSGQDGTLRSAASMRGIRAITVEIGNPQLFHYQFVLWSYLGVMRILNYLNMFPESVESTSNAVGPNTLLCAKGSWIYTRTGGVLEVYPNVNTIVRKGDLIARIKNIFGNIVDEIFAPTSGVVIGCSSNPVAMTGDRVVHMGILKKEGEVLPIEAKENY